MELSAAYARLGKQWNKPDKMFCVYDITVNVCVILSIA
jgi:hypothetical protein